MLSPPLRADPATPQALCEALAESVHTLFIPGLAHCWAKSSDSEEKEGKNTDSNNDKKAVLTKFTDNSSLKQSMPTLCKIAKSVPTLVLLFTIADEGMEIRIN